MADAAATTVHATALVYDGRGVLVRGPSGAGKSRLALALLDDAAARRLDAALVGDDLVRLEAHGGRVVARAPERMIGRIELRGVGLVARPHEAAVVVGLVVDVGAPPPRWPEPETRTAAVLGVDLPHLALQVGDADAVLRVRSRLADDIV